MQPYADLIDRYCEGWSAPDPADRERLLRETLAEDAIYCDPRADNLNVGELLQHIANVQASRPGAKVIRTSLVDGHHNLARFHWCVVLPDGTRLPEGIDVVEFADEKIRRIIGFFGPLQARTTS